MSHPPSPNFGERRRGVLPSIIVLHYTAMNSYAAARQRLCDPLAEVSAHWLISEGGHAEALVAESARAWHAGAGEWAGLHDINSHSIGIELANAGDAPFPEPQITALETLLAGVMTRWSILPERVIAHSDMAPARKCDPGRRFDWRRLAIQGLSVWPEPVPSNDAPGVMPDFLASARAFGYAADTAPSALFEAYRSRFRPWGQNFLTRTDDSIIANLAQRFPVDHPVASA